MRLRRQQHRRLALPLAVGRLLAQRAAIGRDAALGADLSRLRLETKSAKFADFAFRLNPAMKRRTLTHWNIEELG